MVDPYLIPGTNVLKNKVGIVDEKALSQFERPMSTQRIAELQENPIKGNFDYEHLKKIHGHIFQDTYKWAGQERTVTIAKSSTMFCPANNIHYMQQDIFNKLRKDNFLKDLDCDQFSKKAADLLGDLNALHPFREGNGRTQREFLRQIALNAGYELDLKNVPQQQMIDASAQSHYLNNAGLEKIIKERLTPIDPRMLAISQAPTVEKLGKAPSAKDLYGAYAKQALAQGHELKESIDRQVIKNMLTNGVSPRRIEAAMGHSAFKLGADSPEKNMQIRQAVKTVQNENPQLKAPAKSLGRHL